MTTIRQLEYITAIEQHGSFQAAADACHVTQPGLSAQVRQLEEFLEVQIFERGRKPVLVTQAGRELLRRAREVLTAVAELHDTARSLCAPLSGTLRIGVIPTVAPYLLPSVLPAVRRAYPALRLELHEAQTAQLVDSLERGDLDLLLVALEAPLGDAATLPLFEDAFLLATPPGHRLAGRKRIRESDLAGEAVLLLEDGHCLRNQALSVCGRAGASELGDFRASSLATLLPMVASGAGVTLLPALATQGSAGLDADLHLVPFARPLPTRTIGFAWRKRSPRDSEFSELARLFQPPKRTRRRRARPDEPS
jgi:LysR family hydrogen peroxide-inducible transcriptional activator